MFEWRRLPILAKSGPLDEKIVQVSENYSDRLMKQFQYCFSIYSVNTKNLRNGYSTGVKQAKRVQ